MSDGTNVLKFDPVVVGEGYRFEPDEILEEAKGAGFVKVCILGELEDGTVWVSGSANGGETLVLMEMTKRKIVFGEE